MEWLTQPMLNSVVNLIEAVVIFILVIRSVRLRKAVVGISRAVIETAERLLDEYNIDSTEREKMEDKPS